MSAGTRSIAWCDELRPFHGPIPALLIGGRFPPLELLTDGDEKSSAFARARALPKAGLKRVGSAISSVASNRSRAGSRAGSRAASLLGPDDVEGQFADSTFGLDGAAASTDAGDTSQSTTLDTTQDTTPDMTQNDADDPAWSADTWPAPRGLPSKLNLSDPLSGRTYTASRLGAALGSRKVVRFFLGAESKRALAEARAFELTADAGLTPKWYGAYGGFHPRIGSGGAKRADQVMLWALVAEEVGEEVVVDKLWRKEK